MILHSHYLLVVQNPSWTMLVEWTPPVTNEACAVRVQEKINGSRQMRQ